MELVHKNHDRDSSKDVWEQLYKIVYKDYFADIFDFQNISDTETSYKCKRFYAKINKEKNIDLRKKYPKFKIAGDCDFNFNTTKKKLFKKLLKEEDYQRLDRCHITIINCGTFH